ncbi:flagellar protein FlaG [Halomonas llamarensis]|uniref:Flagellar protein FlaG n=1 Tax=Halomonas llamarensis TaxID=2945104 RepID=A0ABT0SNX7_9GAMM|nr:flagellar protein FlaG [Halomonas llamarensis]MCL7929278.1 flagellar protein FlaG [Halomonas llamarensis]
MSSPLTDATHTLSASSPNDVTPRQSLESVFDKLPAAGSQLAQAESNSIVASPSALIEPLQRINEVMSQRGLEFDLSDESSRVITRVIDRESGEVIRQIPAEEVLRIAERLNDLQGGLVNLTA